MFKTIEITEEMKINAENTFKYYKAIISYRFTVILIVFLVFECHSDFLIEGI